MITVQFLINFRSFKRFFLLDQGDFIVQFMDMTDQELKKPISKISEQKLESLLELSIRTSTANCDPYKDDIRYVVYYRIISTCNHIVIHSETSFHVEFLAINCFECITLFVLWWQESYIYIK